VFPKSCAIKPKGIAGHLHDQVKRRLRWHSGGDAGRKSFPPDRSDLDSVATIRRGDNRYHSLNRKVGMAWDIAYLHESIAEAQRHMRQTFGRSFRSAAWHSKQEVVSPD
jgi:hypothetical protein